MSSYLSGAVYSPINADAAGIATEAFGAYGQLSRALKGGVKTVQFERDGITLVAFDAVVQESHSVEAQPTAFPIEDGSTISDHVIRVPRELSLQGIITDTPLDNKDLLVDEAVTSATALIAGPLGVVGLGAAQRFASAKAIAQSTSPSMAAFAQIVDMARGTDSQPPMPFTVKTAIATYPNMIIRSVQVPRDVTTGDALVFGVTLTTMNIVSSQTVAVAVATAVGRQNLERKKEGERALNNSGLTLQEGQNRADTAFSESLAHPDAPVTYTGR